MAEPQIKWLEDNTPAFHVDASESEQLRGVTVTFNSAWIEDIAEALNDTLFRAVSEGAELEHMKRIYAVYSALMRLI